MTADTTAPADTAGIRRGCATCHERVGTLHQHWCTAGRGYVQEESAVDFKITTTASAVTSMLDGELVPTAGPRSPAEAYTRRVELAAIWLAEAEAELNEALLEADANGVGLKELAGPMRMTPEGVRQRLARLRQLPRYGGSAV